MKKQLKYIVFLLTALLAQSYCFAQETTNSGKNPVDSLMLSNGKIFVVVAVVFIIILGLFIYLFSLDKKLARLELEIDKPNHK